MKTCYRFLTVFGLLLFTFAYKATASPVPPEPGVPLFLYALVKGKVMSLVNNGRNYTASVQVEHVFCDAGQNVGKIFVITNPRIEYNGRTTIIPPLQVGQERLWALARPSKDVPYGTQPKWTTQDRDMENYVGNEYGFLSPAMEENNPDYPRLIELAAFVERVCQSAPVQQERLLTDATRSKNPAIYTFAVSRLAYSFRKDFLVLAHKLLSDSKLPLGEQLRVDGGLADKPDNSWSRSPERRSLFEKWARSDLSNVGGGVMEHEHDTNDMLGDFSIAAQNNDLDKATYLALLQAVVDNLAMPVDVRRSAEREMKQEQGTEN